MVGAGPLAPSQVETVSEPCCYDNMDIQGNTDNELHVENRAYSKVTFWSVGQGQKSHLEPDESRADTKDIQFETVSEPFCNVNDSSCRQGSRGKYEQSAGCTIDGNVDYNLSSSLSQIVLPKGVVA